MHKPRTRRTPPARQVSLRTVEELVGAVMDDDWHSLPRWKRIPSLEAGGRRAAPHVCWAGVL